MTATTPTRALVKMSDSKLTVAQPEQDIRGREVVDAAGEKIGTVENLFIDEEQRKVRFIEVGSGGFLGIGESKSLLPVDLVQSVGKDRVQEWLLVRMPAPQPAGEAPKAPELKREVPPNTPIPIPASAN